jgi:hypothetical protein
VWAFESHHASQQTRKTESAVNEQNYTVVARVVNPLFIAQLPGASNMPDKLRRDAHRREQNKSADATKPAHASETFTQFRMRDRQVHVKLITLIEMAIARAANASRRKDAGCQVTGRRIRCSLYLRAIGLDGESASATGTGSSRK